MNRICIDAIYMVTVGKLPLNGAQFERESTFDFRSYTSSGPEPKRGFSGLGSLQPRLLLFPSPEDTWMNIELHKPFVFVAKYVKCFDFGVE